MAQKTFNSIAAGDGAVNNDSGAKPGWNTIHDATSGSSNDDTGVNIEAGVDYTDRWFIKRAFIPFDTSSLPDGATILSATIQLYITEIRNNDNDGDDWINIVGPTTQASTSSLVNADYNQCGAVNNPQELATRIDIGNLTLNQYKTWTLNATGISSISLTGVTKFGVREGHDALDHVPVLGGNQGTKIKFSSSDEVVAKRPILTVTYSLAPFGKPYIFD